MGKRAFGDKNRTPQAAIELDRERESGRREKDRRRKRRNENRETENKNRRSPFHTVNIDL